MSENKKKKLVIIIIFEILFLASVALYFYTNERPLIQGITISRIVGKVVYLRGEILEALTTSTVLQDGDILITGPKSDVIFQFGHQSTLKLMPQSKLNLAEVVNAFETHNPVRLVIPEGSTFLDFHNDKRQGLIVLTKSAALGVRGTQFIVSSDPKEENVKVAVLEGAVEAAREGTPEKSLIHFGQGLVIKATEPLGVTGEEKWVQMIRWDELAEGTEALDSVKENVKNLNEKKILKDNLRVTLRKLRKDSETFITKAYREALNYTEPVTKTPRPGDYSLDEVLRTKKVVDKRNQELDQLLQNE